MSGHPSDSSANEPPVPDWLIEASTAVRTPATLLIMVGVLGVVIAILLVIQLDSLPGKLDQMIALIEADPQLPQADKDKQIDFWTAFRDAAEERTAFLTYYILNIVCSMIVVIGGINMLRLSGPLIPTFSSILAMLPCALGGCCCLLGMPVGIWAIIVLNRPEVRAAMARTPSSEAAYEENDR
jgi:hypothetical protein